MKITLGDESIDIEVGQKVIFYTYRLNDNNELEVLPDETFVDVIREEYNIVGFKNDVRSCTLHFYQNNQFGERYFLSDTADHRLRYLKSRVEYLNMEQKLLDDDIKDAYELLARRKSHRKEVTDYIESLEKLIKEKEGN